MNSEEEDVRRGGQLLRPPYDEYYCMDDVDAATAADTINVQVSGDTAMSSTPTTLSSSSPGALFPKANITKPTRRRSRASKKAPMTLLNASPNNFRALVQQFTGCHSAPAAFGAWKGPINLNFAEYSSSSHQPQHQQRQNRPEHPQNPDSGPSFSSASANSMAATAAATTADDHEMFTVARPAVSLTDLDDWDMEILPVQAGQVGPRDYYSASPETWHDDFWGL